MKIPRVTDFDPDAKIPELKSSLEDMPAIEKRKPVTTPLPPTNKKPDDTPLQPAIQRRDTSKTTNEKLAKSEKFEKYSTYLRPGYKKELKIIALEKDCRDYEVLDEAITQYIKSLQKK
jgi:hypothetical protein